MACPLRYGFSPAEEKRWRGLHLLLLKECPDYDSVADEPFVHRCITEEVLDPAERSDRETILELYAARHASPPPAPTATIQGGAVAKPDFDLELYLCNMPPLPGNPIHPSPYTLTTPHVIFAVAQVIKCVLDQKNRNWRASCGATYSSKVWRKPTLHNRRYFKPFFELTVQ